MDYLPFIIYVTLWVFLLRWGDDLCSILEQIQLEKLKDKLKDVSNG